MTRGHIWHECTLSCVKKNLGRARPHMSMSFVENDMSFMGMLSFVGHSGGGSTLSYAKFHNTRSSTEVWNGANTWEFRKQGMHSTWGCNTSCAMWCRVRHDVVYGVWIALMFVSLNQSCTRHQDLRCRVRHDVVCGNMSIANVNFWNDQSSWLL